MVFIIIRVEAAEEEEEEGKLVGSLSFPEKGNELHAEKEEEGGGKEN